MYIKNESYYIMLKNNVPICQNKHHYKSGMIVKNHLSTIVHNTIILFRESHLYDSTVKCLWQQVFHESRVQGP